MANLPQDSLVPHNPPICNLGIDYFWSSDVKCGRSSVFTCLTVHNEVVYSLDLKSTHLGKTNLFCDENP